MFMFGLEKLTYRVYKMDFKQMISRLRQLTLMAYHTKIKYRNSLHLLSRYICNKQVQCVGSLKQFQTCTISVLNCDMGTGCVHKMEAGLWPGFCFGF